MREVSARRATPLTRWAEATLAEFEACGAGACAVEPPEGVRPDNAQRALSRLLGGHPGTRCNASGGEVCLWREEALLAEVRKGLRALRVQALGTDVAARLLERFERSGDRKWAVRCLKGCGEAFRDDLAYACQRKGWFGLFDMERDGDVITIERRS